MFRTPAEEAQVDRSVARDRRWIFGEIDLVGSITRWDLGLSDSFWCRFSAAGNDEPLHALWRPAAEKRKGTKSREVGH